MKNITILLAFLGLFLGALSAQTVPLHINYQGTVIGGDEVPLGSTGTAPNFLAAPINRKMIFRVYDAQTGGNLLWSEQQTVTISLGQFSVLLGQGTAAVYDSATEARPPLDTVFSMGGTVTPAGPLRFLEILVDDGNGTFTAADTPITPRQRITSTAYAFRAATADTVPDGAIKNSALVDGSVTLTKILDGSINSAKIVNGSITNIDLANNSVIGTNIVDGTITHWDLANGAVTSGKIAVNSIIGTNIQNGTITHWDLADGAVNSAKLALNSVTGDKITDKAVTTVDLADNSVTSIKISDGTITSGDIRDSTIATIDLANGAVTTAKLDSAIGVWAKSGSNLTHTGRVGIGTSSPEVPLHVVGKVQKTMTDNLYGTTGQFTYDLDKVWSYHLLETPGTGMGIDFFSAGGYGMSLTKDQPVTAWVGILSDHWVASARGFIAYSDRRIKRDIHASVTASDLAAIEALQVTGYRMVDPSDGGTAWRKGFIAQEVEKVIPGAVTRRVEFVPDIFSLAKELHYRPIAKTLLVTLKKDHDLKVGDRVRLHVDGSQLDLDVSAVPSAREFEVAKCETAPDKVFVYGKQVDDFRAVDYDRIFTTSVGALQELKKEKDAEVKALQEENASLRSRLAALEEDALARGSRLAAIEKLLAAAGHAEARTVSLKAGE